MNKPRFTPGPWIVGDGEGSHAGYANISGAIGKPREHVGLAEVVVEVDSDRYVEGEANAALIAAAPCLYAALEALCTFGGIDDGTDLISNGLAALAKARGEA